MKLLQGLKYWLTKRKMAKSTIQKIKDQAARFGELRGAIREIREQSRKALEPLEKELEALEPVFWQSMVNQGIKSFKTEQGEAYVRSYRSNIEIEDDKKALVWATKEGLVRIDKTKAARVIAHLPLEKMPEGFKRTQTPIISVRKADEAEKEESED